MADFGLSEMRDSSTSVVAATGTFAWMSPEALRGEEIRKDADMYSYGVVMWECATRERPWANLQGKPRPPVCPTLAVAADKAVCALLCQWLRSWGRWASAARALPCPTPTPPRLRRRCPT
jgi:serine/threonine protein kinase